MNLPLFDLYGYHEYGYKNNFGIDSLELMIEFISVLEAEEGKEQENLDKLKIYLTGKINRELTVDEESNLLQGIIDYVKSDAATPERLTAMDYLFELKFIKE